MGYAALTIRKIAGPDAKGDGIREAARVLEISCSTVWRWKQCGYIPGFRHDEVRRKALAAGVPLGPEDFVDATPFNGAAKASDDPKSQQVVGPSPKLAGAAA